MLSTKNLRGPHPLHMLSIDEADSLIGETLKGAYRIVDRIGAGAMGHVCRVGRLAIGWGSF